MTDKYKKLLENDFQMGEEEENEEEENDEKEEVSNKKNAKVPIKEELPENKDQKNVNDKNMEKEAKNKNEKSKSKIQKKDEKKIQNKKNKQNEDIIPPLMRYNEDTKRRYSLYENYAKKEKYFKTEYKLSLFDPKKDKIWTLMDKYLPKDKNFI